MDLKGSHLKASWVVASVYSLGPKGMEKKD